MGRIRILEDRVVNQIAAGEVVERPASIVKELLENSLDAGARTLRVDLEGGGRTLIAVTDDGCGMDRSDVLMCIERHGTSKLRDERDLFHVGTLGFRGEAIPSIASVSRLEIVSRTAQDEVGTRLVVNGGRLSAPEPVGCPVGTRISARNLFFNVPVRRKFLRAASTELGHCVEAVTRQALITPEVDWTLEHDGRTLLRVPAARDRARRAAELLPDVGEALLPAHLASGTAEVEALLSPVGVHQATAAGSLYLFVNGRYVRDALLRKAVTEAYRNLVPKGRYPVVVLELRLPPEEVDVNVHPAKVEVRFRDAQELLRFVSEGLRQKLEEVGLRRPLLERAAAAWRPPEEPAQAPLALHEPEGPWALPRPAPPRPEPPRPAPPREPSAWAVAPPPPAPRAAALPVPEPAEPPAGLQAVEPAAASPAEPPRAEPPRAEPPRAEPPRAEPPRAEPPRAGGTRALLPVPRFQDLRVIGQLAGTYILCEGAGELVILDQHAAAERVTLHRLQQETRARIGAAQRLLTPLVVELPLAKARALEAHLGLLGELNLEVEPWGGSAFAVLGAPPTLSGTDLRQLLRDLAEDLAEGGVSAAPRDLSDRVLNSMACHNSIRANRSLSVYEMRELLRALDGVDFSVCAHGRPVAIRLDGGELERRFHRA